MPDGNLFDVIIVGGSFSGLSAANTLARQLHAVLVFDSQSYRNARSKHFHLLPTWDHQGPDQFRAGARADLEKYETIKVRYSEVKSVKRESESLFEATDAEGNKWRGRKLILASGVEEIFPAIKGYDECWAYCIYHCMFCHGYEQRGASSAGVLAVDWMASVEMATHMARMVTPLVGVVTIYTNGDAGLASELKSLDSSKPYRVDSRTISKLSFDSASEQLVKIAFEDGSPDIGEAFLAHSPRTKVKGPFAEQLGLELTSMGDYVVHPPFNETSLSGVYAAGDCTTMFKVSVNAIASGSMAAAGLSVRLQEEAAS